ncbi:MAG: diaminopimelate decarboxylase [Acutalibacteraceae bacterium]|jgi:diaminopimelate decarboxylase
MAVMDNTGINPAGHLTFAGCDTVELAKEYGTPLYLMDEDAIRQALRDYKHSIDGYYPRGGMVAYASKACSFKEMYRIVAEEGCGVDVVSGGELYTAMQVGFPAGRIWFHGNHKTVEELRMALEYGVGRIIVDNADEMDRLSAVATAMDKTAAVYLRITPGIDAHTHDFVRTGQIDCKFGFTLENGEAMDGVKRALTVPGIELKGLHCHVGSQIFDEQPFTHAAEVMLAFMRQIRTETGVTLGELNVGGGFGIKYTEQDRPKSNAEYMRLVAAAAHQKADELGFPFPYIVIEPGRSIVAPAGMTLYTVGSVKKIPGVRTYLNVDGGMADNPRYMLYQAPYTVAVANKADQPVTGKVTVAGRCCESGDLIQEHVPLPECEAGDILAVLATGAYNYSMASHYNRLPKPPVVMIRNGQPRVVVRRETYEDVARMDI